ncbi:MAG: nitroreductase family protein [Candidatus Neomarinimicrobiota bacterium]
MKFERYSFKKKSPQDMITQSNELMREMLNRRSIRDFSSEEIPEMVIKNVLKTAMAAPSGANKQPWKFVVVKDENIKKKIRIAAEKEEKKFYEHRATEEWLKDLNKFGTDWNKPFLENAPALIIVFRQSYDNSEGGKRKNYYVNESVGIACGFLLMALQNAGLVSLTHTPSPMGFLERILKRPKNEKAYLLIPVGFPTENAEVPTLNKKSYNKSVEVF